MATGNDILAYKGDAALGLGGDVSSASSGLDNLAGFRSTLNTLQQQDFVWNQMQYRQKIQDRDDTMKLIADNANKVNFDVLDKDRPELEKKLKEIDDAWLQNPDLKSNPEAYSKVQKSIRDFNSMTTSAKTRAAEIAKMKLEYANNPDAEDRASLGAHIKQQEDAGILHNVDPYQKQQSFDMNNVILKGGTVPDVRRYVKDGIGYKSTSDKIDLDEVFHMYSQAAIDGPGKNIPNQWQSIYEHAAVNPEFMSDKNLLAANAALEKINKKEGLSIDDPRYRHPLGVKDENGQWHLNSKVTPMDFAIDAKLLREYDAVPKIEIDRDYNRAILTREQARTQKSQQALNAAKGVTEIAKRNQLNSAADLNRHHAGLYDALAAKAAKEGTVLDDKHLKALAEGSAPVSEATSTFYSAYSNKGTIADAAGLPPSMRSAIGVEPGWSYSEIPKDDPSIKKMLGTPRFGAENSFTAAGKLLGVDYPQRVIVVRSPDGDINKTKLVGLNKNEKGAWVATKVVDGNTGYGNIIMADNGYKKTDKTVDLENKSRFAIQLAQGSSAAGVDMNAIIANRGVIGNSGTPVTENSGDDEPDSNDENETDESNDGEQGDGEEGDGEEILPMSSFTSADVRGKGKDMVVRVKGEWRPVIAADKKTRLVKVKKKK